MADRSGMDGQHRQGPGAGTDTGERSKRSPGAEVGQDWGGSTSISNPGPAADISTTYYVPGTDEEQGEPSERE